MADSTAHTRRSRWMTEYGMVRVLLLLVVSFRALTVTATQNSGLPLPLPILVSNGFLEAGLSGKILNQILPPRLIYRVMAIRAASIWRLVIRPHSKA